MRSNLDARGLEPNPAAGRRLAGAVLGVYRERVVAVSRERPLGVVHRCPFGYNVVVSNFTNELPRESWRAYFDDLSRALGTVQATVEVDGDDLGAQIEAENLVLRGVSYDDRDDILVIALDAPGDVRADLEHMVSRPQRIFVDSDGVVPDAIDVEDADGRKTIVQLHPAPELSGE
jgi:hypothetical protein